MHRVGFISRAVAIAAIVGLVGLSLYLVFGLSRIEAGKSADLPPLPVQYVDYATWQRDALTGPRLESLLEYWRDRLEGAPAFLELPADRPRPPRFTYRGARLSFELPAGLRDGLKALSRAEGTTLFMTLLSGFSLLLARYSGQRDVVVGTPIAGRLRPELEDMIGFFANTLALRTSINEAQSFRELLAEVRTSSLGAFTHQQMPFEQLVEVLKPQRDLSRNPVFQVMFALQNMALPELALGELELRPWYLPRDGAQLDLTLYMWESDDGLQGTFEYATDLFDERTIERLAEHLATLLQAVVREPDADVLHLPLLDEQEHGELVARGRGSVLPVADGETVLTWLEQRTAESPEAIAAEYEGERISFAELDVRANKLAHYLQGKGVGSESLVGVCVPRSLDMLVAVLGVIKAGGAWLPLDPDFPEERLRFMLEDSGARVLVSLSSVPVTAEGLALERVDLDRDAALLAAADASAPGVSLSADQLAYTIYTSGSTGRPKGVQIEQRALVNFLRSMAREPGVSSSDVLVAVTTLSFDISILELLLPLVSGARLVIASRDTASDGQRLAATLADSNATLMQATPATWRLLIEAGWQGDGRLKALCGGEALPADLADALLARCGELWNLYGPTETTIWSTCAQVTDAHSIHIGQPIGNTSIYIVDGQGQLQPVGVPGEIWIGGEGVARGYLGRPELTAERFLEDPFSPGARVYRTGDLGRWRSDGTLQHLGRMDTQVKVRGFRIELGEIEARLAELESIDQAAVSVWEPTSGDQRLVAYYTGEAELPAPELRAHLQQSLPDYMVPQLFMRLEALPLTPNGKLDRKALPAPQAVASVREYTPPQGDTETRLAAIWQELLGAERIGREDNFFELGGHSLLAARSAARLNAEFGIELPLRTFFEAPTTAGLAARIDRLRGDGSIDYAPIERRDPSVPAPVSFAQEQLWYLQELSPQSTAYNIGAAVELRGVLDLPALEQSFACLVHRHEPLRTRFVPIDGTPVQEILEPSAFALEVIDSPNLSDAALAGLLEKRSREAFDLRAGPSFRAMLYRLAPERAVLYFDCHHIVMDGWSLGVFARELCDVYNRLTSGAEVNPEPVSITYADYAAWQRSSLEGQTLEDLLAYWRDNLQAAPPQLELPTDRPRPAQFSYRGASHEFKLPAALRDSLQNVARQEGATLFMVLLAAFQLLLARYSGQRDLVVGTPVANRVRPELEELIGDFVNTLALRTKLGDEWSFRDLLQAVRETCLGAFAHQAMPFEKLVEALQPPQDLSRNPVFQVMFGLQNMALPALDLGNLEAAPWAVPRGGAQLDLTLYMWESEEGLQGTFEYATDLFDAATVEGMAGNFRNLLEAALDDPDAGVFKLPLLDPAERDELLSGRNRTAVALPADETVLTLLAARPGHAPEAVAAEYEGTSISYAELEARSNRLAQHLRAAGVGSGSVVGLCLPRGLDMLVGLLAIVKAGGAWLPLDPEFPEDRLSFMLEDSGADVLVSVSSVTQAAIDALPLVRVNLDTDQALIDACSDAAPDVQVSGDQLAYMIYTSGSTGRPKGVQVEHRALANFLRSMAKTPGFEASDVLLAVTTLSFDISILEMLLPLVCGGRIIIASRDTAVDSQELADAIAGSGVTVMQATPATWRLLVESGWQGDGRLKALCGGEALPTDLAAALLERCGELWNMYGPTETTIWSSCARITDADSLHIGTPIDNTQMYVLNDTLQPQPIELDDPRSWFQNSLWLPRAPRAGAGAVRP